MTWQHVYHAEPDKVTGVGLASITRWSASSTHQDKECLPWRNLFTSGGEHEASYRGQLEKSFMQKYHVEEQSNAPGNCIAKVTGSASDCLTRQVREGVQIWRCQVPVKKWMAPTSIIYCPEQNLQNVSSGCGKVLGSCVWVMTTKEETFMYLCGSLRWTCPSN